MKPQQYELWLADLNPQFGTAPGKIRPVVVVQTGLLNAVHASTIVCPVTTKVQPQANVLQVHLKKSEANVPTSCNVMVDHPGRLLRNASFEEPESSRRKK